MSKSEMILELQDEVKALKAKLGGYQTSNENYRKANEALGNELDVVRENLKMEIERNEEYDKKNHDAINQFYREKEQMRARIAVLENEKQQAEDEAFLIGQELKAYKELPWYKRIFAK